MFKFVMFTLITAFIFSGSVSAQIRIGQSVSAIGEFPLAFTSRQNLERAAIVARNQNIERFQAFVIAGACEIIRESSHGEILSLDNINGVRIAQVRFQPYNGNQADGWIVVADLLIIID